MPNFPPIIGPVGGDPENPKLPDYTQGGFRTNRHHEAMEVLADDRYCGSEFLRQEDGGYPDDKLTEGYQTMLNAVDPVGVNRSKVSPWSKGK